MTVEAATRVEGEARAAVTVAEGIFKVKQAVVALCEASHIKARAIAQADHGDYSDGPSDDSPSDDEPYEPEIPEDPKRDMARCIFGDAADPEGPDLTYRYTLSKADSHPAHPQPLPHELY